MKTLYDEAIELLSDVRVLNSEESQIVMNELIDSFPFQTTGNGQIDWNKVENYLTLNCIGDIKKQKKLNLNDKCFVTWNDQTYPIIETNLGNVIDAFDDITAVSFDTWVYIPDRRSVVESIFGSLKAFID